jgi:hypothetical protein
MFELCIESMFGGASILLERAAISTAACMLECNDDPPLVYALVKLEPMG